MILDTTSREFFCSGPLQCFGVEIARNTKCVSASCVSSGRGAVAPLHSATFFHIVTENKYACPPCGLWRKVRRNSVYRERCDPTQHFKYGVVISAKSLFQFV